MGIALSKAAKAPDFEKALSELEPLDDALKTFERGVALTRQCQEALKAAQARVEILAARGDGTSVEPFEPDDDAG